MEPVPGDARRAWQIAAVVIAGAIGTALVVALLWMLFRPDPAPPVQSGIDPAVETSVTPSASPAPSSPATETTSTTTSRTPDAAQAPGRAQVIAFRLGGSLYVAKEDGTGSRSVTRSVEGPYALSPDGKSLAVVGGAKLSLVDAASGAVTSVGAAEAAVPVWAPDSSAVYFIRLGGTRLEVWKVARDGRGAQRLAEGSAVAVSPDGRTVAVRRDAQGGAMAAGAVYVSRDGGSFRPVTVMGQPTSVAVTGDRLLVGVVNEAGEASIVSAGLDGRGAKRLVGSPAGTTPAVWGELHVSPDGDRFAAVAIGDDGYSRVSIVAVASGAETRLSRRRDGYIRGWSADGRGLFVLEGNYFQGEATTLTRMALDGTVRTPVVTGAE